MSKIELLVLKAAEDYLRVRDGEYLKCGLDKASVFPMTRKKEVLSHLARLGELGFSSPAVSLLELEEEPYLRG